MTFLSTTQASSRLFTRLANKAPFVNSKSVSLLGLSLFGRFREARFDPQGDLRHHEQDAKHETAKGHQLRHVVGQTQEHLHFRGYCLEEKNNKIQH